MWPFSKKKPLEFPDFWWEYEEHFKEKLPELHVIGAGSLLEFAFLAKDFRMPVGRIEFLFLKHRLIFFSAIFLLLRFVL